MTDRQIKNKNPGSVIATGGHEKLAFAPRVEISTLAVGFPNYKHLIMQLCKNTIWMKAITKASQSSVLG